MFATFMLQGQDTLRGPHGGAIKSSGNYRVELLECNEYFEAYLFTKDMDGMSNYGITGDIKYFYSNGTSKSSPLTFYGNDGFTAKVPDGGFIYCRVTMDILGTPISIKFENQDCSIGAKNP